MNNITILLTTTVIVQPHKCYLYQTNPQERLNDYLKAITNWLNNTKLNIVVVENSGYTFNELSDLLSLHNNRFELIRFNESDLEDAHFLRNNNSKGSSEVYSINYAFNNSKLLQNSKFIIKITGRYFISEFEDYLSKIINLTKYDMLVQNEVDKCEIVGCNTKHFKDVFNNNLLDKYGNYNGHVEYVYTYRASLYKNILRCKVFNIEYTQRGGTPEMYNKL